MTPNGRAEIDLYNALEDACTAALERIGAEIELSERDEIALAQEIVTSFAARGVRMNISRPRDRLRLIIKERREATDEAQP